MKSRKIVSIILLTLGAINVGCNSCRGFGLDLQGASEGIARQMVKDTDRDNEAVVPPKKVSRGNLEKWN